MSEVVDEQVDQTAQVDESLAAGAGAGDIAPVETETVEAQQQQFDPRELEARIEHLTEQNAQLVQWARQQGASPAQAQQYATDQTGFDPARLNPLEDDFGQNFAEFMSQRDKQLLGAIDEKIQAFTQPFQQQQEHQVIAEGEQQMRDVIADEFSRGGDLIFAGDDQVKVVDKIIDEVRNRYFPEAAERYGMNNRAAEIAISQAVQAERDYQKRIGDAAIAAQANRNATLAGQRHEVGAAATAGLQTTPSEILPPGALARQYSRNPVRTTP